MIHQNMQFVYYSFYIYIQRLYMESKPLLLSAMFLKILGNYPVASWDAVADTASSCFVLINFTREVKFKTAKCLFLMYCILPTILPSKSVYGVSDTASAKYWTLHFITSYQLLLFDKYLIFISTAGALGYPIQTAKCIMGILGTSHWCIAEGYWI